ncbi:glycoside hydrolase family 88 protein [Marasmius fiardii PR-910]|nr:glycoside hydrolase family 88 protein [Marasmius fiardii PR-910]
MLSIGKFSISFIVLNAFIATTVAQANSVPSELLSPLIPQKLQNTFNSLPQPVQYPQYTDSSRPGKWLFFVPDTWTSAFFPTTLYEMDRRQTLCGGSNVSGVGINWRDLGRSASQGLINLPGHNTQGHDVGFLSFPFVEEWKRNPQDQTAIKTINGFALDLAKRYIPAAKVTRSWDNDNQTVVRVIIDNMMNLEVLFVSAELTGNQTLVKIAKDHADTTMKNHIRADGSTWHVVEYDADTGAVLSKHTAQGFSDNSTWSRGQAWGIYGYAQMYSRTQNPAYLETARRLATYFIDNIPSDGIVPWDFNAPLKDPKVPGGVRPADSSAATIAANALLLLGELDSESGDRWISAALNILNHITKLAYRPQWDSLLSNGTVNWPANNYLTGTVYGDHYFVKTGNDLVEKGLARC